ncbi:MAG: metal-dependent transcriptional regulator [Bacteroidota bacterium]|jgi:DtxR family Mn-dependent transcriptional regulator
MHRTRTTEDYLKAICMLEQRGQRVSTSALATRLHLADASITEMLKKLSRRGLVRYERYRGVELTVPGRKLAIKIMRRHRLWEMFLVKFLGFSWDQIHEEAERLEHVTSDLLEQQLDRALGHPNVDPHGDPIPTVDGVLRDPKLIKLAESRPGSIVLVTRVRDGDPEILRYMALLGIGLGKKIRVKEAIDFDGSLRVQIGAKEQFISAKLAESIYVGCV